MIFWLEWLVVEFLMIEYSSKHLIFIPGTFSYLSKYHPDLSQAFTRSPWEVGLWLSQRWWNCPGLTMAAMRLCCGTAARLVQLKSWVTFWNRIFKLPSFLTINTASIFDMNQVSLFPSWQSYTLPRTHCLQLAKRWKSFRAYTTINRMSIEAKLWSDLK